MMSIGFPRIFAALDGNRSPVLPLETVADRTFFLREIPAHLAFLQERKSSEAHDQPKVDLAGRRDDVLMQLSRRADLVGCLANPGCVNLKEPLINRVSEPDMAVRLTEDNSVIAREAGQNLKHNPPLLVCDESKNPIEVGREMNEPPAHAEQSFGHDFGDIVGRRSVEKPFRRTRDRRRLFEVDAVAINSADLGSDDFEPIRFHRTQQSLDIASREVKPSIAFKSNGNDQVIERYPSFGVWLQAIFSVGRGEERGPWCG